MISQKLVDDFIKSVNDKSVEVAKIDGLTLQTITWLQSWPKLLDPIYQAGKADGIKEGVKREREKARILKSN